MELSGPHAACEPDNRFLEAGSTDDTVPLLDNYQKHSIMESSYGAVMDQNTTQYYSTDENNDVHRMYYHEILLSIICNMNALTMGFVMGFASPTVPRLRRSGMLSDEQIVWYEALPSIGATVGTVMSTLLIETAGRKDSIMISALPFTLGWFSIVLAQSYIPLYVGQFLIGVAAGIGMMSCGLYLAESVSYRIRGAMMMSQHVIITLGMLIFYSLGLVLETNWLALVAMFPTAAMAVGLFFVPRSPRWLIHKGRRDEAIEALCWLRQDTLQSIQVEVDEIEHNIEIHDKATAKIHFIDLKRLWRPLTIGLTLLTLQTFCGHLVVMMNTQDIFYKAGFTGSGENAGGVPAIMVAVEKVISTIIVLPLLDKFGRRPFCIISGVLMTLSLTVLGTYFYLQDTLDAKWVWISLVALIIFTAAYSLGWGSISFIVASEILPSEYRGRAFGCSMTINYVLSFVLLAVYPVIVGAIAWSGLFWLFAAISLAGVFFCIFIMPETKLKSLENIEQEIFTSVKNSPEVNAKR